MFSQFSRSVAMSTLVLSPQLVQILEAASQLVDVTKSAALLIVVEQRLDWSRLRDLLGALTVLIASDDAAHLVGVTDHGMDRVMIDVAGLPVHERLTQALLECVAADAIGPESQVVAVYSGFEAGTVDSVSVLRLTEHLGQLTSRDLRNLDTKVPLETL